jgi:crotonobetainyl-CoA:carnitine CoA-transferase CaiB-like acyl-CoA transferase
MTGDPDRPPARVALATTDYLTSVQAAFGALAAIHRTATEDWPWSSGRRSALRSSVRPDGSLSSPPMTSWASGAQAGRRLEPADDGAEQLSTRPATASWVLIAANSQPDLCAAWWPRCSSPDLLTDPRFETIQRPWRKPENMQAMDAIVGQWTRALTPKRLETLLRDGEVPTSTRLHHRRHLRDDPHFAGARDAGQQVPHPSLGHTTQAGIVPRLSATPGRHPATPAPTWAPTRWTSFNTTWDWPRTPSSRCWPAAP